MHLPVYRITLDVTLAPIMAVRVVEFSNGVYKIRKIFCKEFYKKLWKKIILGTSDIGNPIGAKRLPIGATGFPDRG